jgi:hypothetical protein
VEQLHKGVQDDHVGTVENAVGQVEDLVELLRAHGADGVSESSVSVVRHALGDASRKCLRRLKTAVGELESASGQGSALGAEQVLSADAVQEVMLYLDLVGRLEVATVEFGFAQVAFDCHSGKPHVAVTRAEQVTRSTDELRREIDDVCGRLARLNGSVRQRFQSWWRLAGKEIVASAGFAVAGAGSSAVLAAAPAAAEHVKDGGGSADGPRVAAAAAFGAVVGLAGGLVRGTRNTVYEVRAKGPLEGRLEQLTAAGGRTLEARGETTPALEWLHHLTKELAGPGG